MSMKATAPVPYRSWLCRLLVGALLLPPPSALAGGVKTAPLASRAVRTVPAAPPIAVAAMGIAQPLVPSAALSTSLLLGLYCVFVIGTRVRAVLRARRANPTPGAPRASPAAD